MASGGALPPSASTAHAWWERCGGGGCPFCSLLDVFTPHLLRLGGRFPPLHGKVWLDQSHAGYGEAVCARCTDVLDGDGAELRGALRRAAEAVWDVVCWPAFGDAARLAFLRAYVPMEWVDDPLDASRLGDAYREEGVNAPFNASRARARHGRRGEAMFWALRACLWGDLYAPHGRARRWEVVHVAIDGVVAEREFLLWRPVHLALGVALVDVRVRIESPRGDEVQLAIQRGPFVRMARPVWVGLGVGSQSPDDLDAADFDADYGLDDDDPFF
mmetsp:Transcript_10468/g.35515  ORF Transcript_10468/g.35515 Transcript_10468/m.35515 type:complete len:273 (+) Transcript_10468:39-857(+)